MGGLKGDCSEVGDVLVRLLRHFSQLGHDLKLEDLRVEICSGRLDNTSYTELHVGYPVTRRLDECRQDMLSDLFLGEDWNACSEGHNCAHTVVVALLINVVTVNYLRHKVVDSPVGTKCFSKYGGLFNTHITHRGCCVRQVLHKNCFKTSLENFYTKCCGKFSNQFKNCHTDAPLCIFSEGC